MAKEVKEANGQRVTPVGGAVGNGDAFRNVPLDKGIHVPDKGGSGKGGSSKGGSGSGGARK